jgi:hypothetical protein
MRKLLAVVLLSMSLFLVAPVSSVSADHGWRTESSWSFSSFWAKVRSWFSSWGSGSWGSGSGRSATAVPELDASGAGSAIVLLVGGVAYIASRRREDH